MPEACGNCAALAAEVGYLNARVNDLMTRVAMLRGVLVQLQTFIADEFEKPTMRKQDALLRVQQQITFVLDEGH